MSDSPGLGSAKGIVEIDVSSAIRSLDLVTNKLVDFGKVAERQVQFLKAFDTSTTAAAASLSKTTTESDRVANAAKRLTSEEIALLKAQRDLARSSGDYAGALRIQDSILGKLTPDTVGYVRAQQDAVRINQQAEKAADQAAKAQERLARSVANAADPGTAGRFGAITSSLGGLAAGFRVAAVAGVGLSAVGERLKQGFDLVAELNQNRQALGTLLQDQERGNAVFEQAIKFGQQYGFTQQEMGAAAQGAAQLIRNSSVEVEKQFEIIARLASLNPEEGFAGASRAISELASGDIASIVERFNQSRGAMNALKDEVAAGADVFEVLDGYLTNVGVSADVLSNRMTGAAGAAREATLAQERLNIALGNLATSESVVAGINAVSGAITNLANALNYGTNRVQVEADLLQRAETYEQYVARIEEANRRLFEQSSLAYDDPINQAVFGLETLTRAQFEYVQSLVANGTATDEAMTKVRGLNDVTLNLTSILDGSRTKSEEVKGTIAELGGEILKAADGGAGFTKNVNMLLKALVEGRVSSADFASAINDLNVAQEASTEASAADLRIKEELALRTQDAANATNEATSATDRAILAQLEDEAQTRLNAQAKADLALNAQNAALAMYQAGDGSAAAAAKFAAQYGVSADLVMMLYQLEQQARATAAALAAADAKTYSENAARGYGAVPNAAVINARVETARAAYRRQQQATARAGAARSGGSAPRSGSAGGTARRAAQDPQTDLEAALDVAKQQEQLLAATAKIAEYRDQLKNVDLSDLPTLLPKLFQALAVGADLASKAARQYNVKSDEATRLFVSTATASIKAASDVVQLAKDSAGVAGIMPATLEWIVRDLEALTRMFADANQRIGADAVREAAALGAKISDITGGVPALVEAVQATKGYEGQIANGFDWLFADAVALTIKIADMNARLTDEELLNATSVGKLLDEITGGIPTLVAGIVATRNYQGQLPGGFDWLAADALALALKLDDVRKQISDAALKNSTELGAALNDLAGGLVSLVEGIAATRNYQGALPGAFDWIGADVRDLLLKFEDVARQLNLEALPASRAVAETLGVLLDPLSVIVGLAKAVNEYKGILPAAAKLLLSDAIGMQAHFEALVRESKLGEPKAVEAAQALDTSFGALGTVIDTLDALGKREPLGDKVVGALEGDFYLASAALSRMAIVGNTFQQNATTWYDTIVAGAAKLRDGIDVLGGLNGLSVSLQASIQTSTNGGAGGAPSGSPPPSNDGRSFTAGSFGLLGAPMTPPPSRGWAANGAPPRALSGDRSFQGGGSGAVNIPVTISGPISVRSDADIPRLAQAVGQEFKEQLRRSGKLPF